MAARRTARSNSGTSSVILIVLVLFVLAGTGTGVTLWAMGIFSSEPEVSREGQVAFPSLTRPIKAYEKITREDLIDLKTQQLRPIWLDKELANKGMLRDLSKIIGRVVARDKQPGYILTEADLLPIGTRAGVTAGVPAGKRSFSFDIEKVPGIELLRQGDRFDILAALPTRDEPLSSIEPASLLGGIKPPDTRIGQLARQTGIKPLVLGGTMVALTKGATQSTAGAQPLVPPNRRRGTRKEHKTIATIAVESEEVSPLTEALGLEVDLYCVARSGHQDKNEKSKETVSFEGMIPVVATSKNINAFTALRAEHLADSVTGRLNIFYFKPEQIENDWVTDYKSLEGRVVSRKLPPGSVLTQKMLLPEGTRPGLVAGAPTGTVVLPVSTSSIEGLGQLKPGDKFSVYVRLPKELRPAYPRTDWASLQGAVRSVEDQKLEEELQTGVSQVLKEAVFVGNAEEASSQNSKEKTNSNKKDKSNNDQIVGIAIPESGVVQISRLLEKDSDLFVTAVSGRIEKTKVAPQAKKNNVAELISQPRFDDIVPASELMTVAFSSKDEIETQYISIPVTARKVKAYTKLTVADFVDPSTGNLRILMFPADRVKAGWAQDVNTLVDRVVSKDIDAGRAIDQANLLPAGTLPGSAAGIPSGMLGISITGLQVQGLSSISTLQRGDRFKLLASKPFNFNLLNGKVRRTISGSDAIKEMESMRTYDQRASVNVLCHDVVLVDFGDEVETVQTRTSTETHSKSETQLTENGPVRVETQTSIPQVSERVVKTKSFLLAVNPSEISSLTEALSLETKIIAVPLPGSTNSSPALQASVSSEKNIVAKNNRPRPTVMEHIRGDQISREVWVNPTAQGKLDLISHNRSEPEAPKSP